MLFLSFKAELTRLLNSQLGFSDKGKNKNNAAFSALATYDQLWKKTKPKQKTTQTRTKYLPAPP